jgi:hypothetical protein
MARKTTRTPKGSAAWELEFVKLIALPAEPVEVLEQDWWTNVAGDKPDDFVSTRRMGSRDDRGAFQDTLLALTVTQSESISMVWETRPLGIVDALGNFPTFKEPFRERIDWFVRLIRDWLTTCCPTLARIAFSAKFLHQAANAKEAYKFLGHSVPRMDLRTKSERFCFVHQQAQAI